MAKLDPSEKALLKRIGKHIKTRRLALFGSRSNAELARRAGVTKPTIASAESGETNCTVLVLAKIASGLECSLADLLHE